MRWPCSEPCLIPRGVLISSGASAWGPARFHQQATETDKCGIGKNSALWWLPGSPRREGGVRGHNTTFGALLPPLKILTETSQ